MKVYYDREKDNIALDNIGRYFANGTLEAIESNGRITIRNKNTNINELHMYYYEFVKEDDSSAGDNINETIDYLNAEFAKGIATGDGSFLGTATTETITDDRIKSGDFILVTPVSVSVTPDILLVVNVIDGAFTVSRMLITGILYTSNLPFKWKVI